MPGVTAGNRKLPAPTILRVLLLSITKLKFCFQNQNTLIFVLWSHPFFTQNTIHYINATGVQNPDRENYGGEKRKGSCIEVLIAKGHLASCQLAPAVSSSTRTTLSFSCWRHRAPLTREININAWLSPVHFFPALTVFF